MENFNQDLQARVQRNFWNDAVDILLVQGKSVAAPLTMIPREEGMLLQPTLTLHQEDAQSLFNQLWAQGFRPKDGTGNSGHIASMQYHLEDMRKLVFKGK